MILIVGHKEGKNKNKSGGGSKTKIIIMNELVGGLGTEYPLGTEVGDWFSR